MLKVWRKARLVAIHKKGDTGDPHRYRAVSIISQKRKVVEKSLDIHLRQLYESHLAQLGFNSKAGIENAILRSTYLSSKLMGYEVVLDVKKAYNTVPLAQGTYLCPR